MFIQNIQKRQIYVNFDYPTFMKCLKTREFLIKHFESTVVGYTLTFRIFFYALFDIHCYMVVV